MSQHKVESDRKPSATRIYRDCFCRENAVLPDGINLIGRYRCRSSSSLPEHVHREGFELCFIAHGTMSYQIGGRCCDIHAGELHLCRPGVVHSGVNNRLSPCLLYWMEVNPEILLPSTATADFFRIVPGGKLKLPDPERWRQECEAMLKECAAEHVDRGEMLRSRMCLLLIELARAWMASRETRMAFSPPVAAVLAAMESDPLCERPLRSVLAVSKLAGSAIYQRFRAETGYAPHEYRLRLKVEQARRLLSFHRLSITEVAFQSNFSSSQYFSSVFRKITGYSPRRWRELLRRDSAVEL